MKKTAAILAGLTLLALTGCVAPPTATTTAVVQEQPRPVQASGEELFLTAVAYGFVDPAVARVLEGETLQTGMSVCLMVTEGRGTWDDALLSAYEFLSDPTVFHSDMPIIFIDAADMYLC